MQDSTNANLSSAGAAKRSSATHATLLIWLMHDKPTRQTRLTPLFVTVRSLNRKICISTWSYLSMQVLRILQSNEFSLINYRGMDESDLTPINIKLS
jgi:hypothetical protein